MGARFDIATREQKLLHDRDGSLVETSKTIGSNLLTFQKRTQLRADARSELGQKETSRPIALTVETVSRSFHDLDARSLLNQRNADCIVVVPDLAPQFLDRPMLRVLGKSFDCF